MTKILIGSGNETTILRSQHDLDQARDLLGVTHQRINYETGRLLAEPKALGIGSVVNLGAEFMQGGTAHGLIGGVCAPSQRERRCCSGGVYAGERDGDRPPRPRTSRTSSWRPRNAGIDPALALAVSQRESNFKATPADSVNKQVNKDGIRLSDASGLFQLTGQTQRQLNVTDPFDPAQNANAGTAYIASS